MFVPVDAGEDGLLEFLAAQVLLGAGFQEAGKPRSLAKLLNLAPADAQTAGIDAAGRQQFGERLARGPREVAIPLAQRLERSSFWPSKTSTASAVSSM